MLRIYGALNSRALRTLWTAEELNLRFEHIPLQWDDPVLKTADFLKLNPAGTVPTLADGNFSIGESLIINLYLAKNYTTPDGPMLYPTDAKDEARVWLWTLWAQGELEPWLQHDGPWRRLRGSDPGAAAVYTAKSLTRLDLELSSRDWLVGPAFTIADLNVAAILSPSRVRGLDLAPHPNVAKWLDRCYSRPAAQRVRSGLDENQ